MTKEEAEQCMAHEPYKLELVRDILARDPGATITLYHIGERSPCIKLRRHCMFRPWYAPCLTNMTRECLLLCCELT